MPDDKYPGQGQKKPQPGDKGSTNFEKEDVKEVSNDNDVDRDLDEDEKITQRSPRMGEQGKPGADREPKQQ